MAIYPTKGQFSHGLLVCHVEYSASPTPKVLPAQPIGAPLIKVKGWANSQLTKYHFCNRETLGPLNNFKLFNIYSYPVYHSYQILQFSY